MRVPRGDDLHALTFAQALAVVFTGPRPKISRYRSPNDVYIDKWVYELLDLIERTAAKRVLIDSLSDLQYAAPIPCASASSSTRSCNASRARP
jgi:hypothetical protein